MSSAQTMRLETEEEYNSRIKAKVNEKINKITEAEEFKKAIKLLQAGTTEMYKVDAKLSDYLVTAINETINDKFDYVYLSYHEALKHKGIIKEIPIN